MLPSVIGPPGRYPGLIAEGQTGQYFRVSTRRRPTRARVARSWQTPDLRDCVAVVTGATRKAGRGIAEVLGECGATVYVTGRSTRDEQTHPEIANLTIEDAAEAVTSRGGLGVPVRCDHRVDAQTKRLFRRVEKERGRLDILVNNVVGWSDRPHKPENVVERMWEWDDELWYWDANFTSGLRAHFAACYFGIPLMLREGRGLIVFTNEPVGSVQKHIPVLYVRAHATKNLVASLGVQLRGTDVSPVAVVPGWLEHDESVEYVGRAVAMLAADPCIGRKAGRTLLVQDLAREYGFTDIDGKQPQPYG